MKSSFNMKSKKSFCLILGILTAKLNVIHNFSSNVCFFLNPFIRSSVDGESSSTYGVKKLSVFSGIKSLCSNTIFFTYTLGRVDSIKLFTLMLSSIILASSCCTVTGSPGTGGGVAPVVSFFVVLAISRDPHPHFHQYYKYQQQHFHR